LAPEKYGRNKAARNPMPATKPECYYDSSAQRKTIEELKEQFLLERAKRE